jgi:hypothetical protein
MEFGLLGQQLLLALRFAEHGFDRDELFECRVTQNMIPGKELFRANGKRFFMAPDSLPGHLAIKAIALNAHDILLETSKIDAAEANEHLQTEGLPVVLKQDGAWKDGKPFIRFKFASGRGKHGADRCLWVIPWSKSRAADRQLMLYVADLVYNADAYQTEGVDLPTEPVTSVQGVQKMELRLNLELQQRLDVEQRPDLSLEMELRPEVMLAMVQRIKKMTPDELLAEAMKDPSPAGQRKFLNYIVCTLAEPVVKTNPGMTYAEARKRIRRLIRKGARQQGPAQS